MNYKETLDYLFNSTPVFEHVGASAYKEGLYNTLALDEHFGHPHKNFKTIHIAGTNGKGSCSHSLAAMLQLKGYKVGLYTSPHIVDFRERIRVNGQCVSEDYVIDFVEKERSFFEPLHPSFFELTTAMAFKYFAQQNVDIAVVEVGLGGRLDCTNIINPLLSIITNISLDHTQFLGNTLAKIAGEKAGIIKPNTPVVIGEEVAETHPVFVNKAAENNAPITFAQKSNEIISSEADETGGRIYVTKHFGTFHGELGGDYQVCNMNTILNAVNVLKNNGLDISDCIKALDNIVESTGLVGRWMNIHEEPRAICDTGHNVGGWQYLSKQIKAQKCDQLRIVFGMVDDKDIDSVMDMLPQNAIYYWTQTKNKRAIPAETVAEKGLAHHLKGNIYKNVKEAYEKALSESGKDDFIFVGGSSYIVADLLS
ncbi:MAG: bifunctional folylpolyglutamate synthase/dihydrofolate synthase [Prevotella sp.]|jgi:dihydrofolate synthase/folylpolyglutamate synthase|nr:folylpolyglutamate synthase/dihydrofolate synthase family protein [Prevotella sp.]